MSWGEVKKINSDFANEPLNFNNYINDISTFKENSYVLDKQNEGLWRALISQSLTLFGHTAIHDVVYNRLTDADVDYMLRNNGRLGQSFNSFYRIASFTSGAINDLIKDMTASAYTKLELKIQAGINRYISDMTSGESAGEWLGNIFSIDALKEKTDMASILSDTALWNSTISTNESLRYTVCLSAATINWFSETNRDAFLSFITEIAHSTTATMDFFDALAGTDMLTIFFSTENVVSIMANNEESMKGICYSTDPFAAMIASETAMNIVAASDTAMNVIIDAIKNAANSEIAISDIKGNLTAIESSLPNISDTEGTLKEISETKANITDTLSSIQTVTNRIDVLLPNAHKLLEDAGVARKIVSLQDKDLFLIIANSQYSETFARTIVDNAIGTPTTTGENFSKYKGHILAVKSYTSGWGNDTTHTYTLSKPNFSLTYSTYYNGSTHSVYRIIEVASFVVNYSGSSDISSTVHLDGYQLM